jgi:hypothetical protein
VTLTAAKLGFCVDHYLVAYPCSFDPSCPYRCAAHSRTRLCQEHSWYAYKLRRQALADAMPPTPEE